MHSVPIRTYIYILPCPDRLDEALSNYLGQAQEYTEQEQAMEFPMPVRKCPSCNRDMVLRQKKDSTM